MKRFAMGILTALFSGLFLFCTNSYASELLPKSGFSKMEEDIECEPVKYILTETEKDLLLRVGVLEAGEVDEEGIANVIQVVLNRYESDKFPDTVEEVIHQKNPRQFPTAKRLAKANITEAAENALDAVIVGEYTDNEALYFESLPGKAWENVHEYLFSYGGHDFYK